MTGNIALGSTYLSGDGGSEGVLVDSAGRVTVKAGDNLDYDFSVVDEGDTGASDDGGAKIAITGYADDSAQGGGFNLQKSRGTIGSPTALLNGDVLGAIKFRGMRDTSGVFPVPNATIRAYATQNFSGTQSGTNLVFHVTGDNSNNLNEILSLSWDTTSGWMNMQGNIAVWGSVSNCTLGDGTAGVNCGSDERLKDNITPIPNALEKVKTISGVDFTWNHLAPAEGKTGMGVIAQDVIKVFPTAVVENSEGFLTVDYAVLIAPLIEAAKELAKRQDSLEEKQKEMEREIASLKEENAVLKEYLCAKDKDAPFCK
jgi:hypothetical protein